MHQATIRRIAVDRDERFLVTAADDKTARIWNLKNGKLLLTFRPPIEKGTDNGKLYAVAITPNGHTIAVSGYTGPQGQPKTVYIFDRVSGQIIHRISGLPGVVNQLTFSLDGRYLAVNMGTNTGLRIYQTANWNLIYTDANYGSDSYGADFDVQGRLVTSSYDGYIRLYDANFKLQTQIKPPGGPKPYGVAFNPDGTQIAVGFAHDLAINILSGNNLSLLAKPNTEGINKGYLAAVAWSQDGLYLYAGQGADTTLDTYLIRRWSNKGTGTFQDFPVAQETIMDLQSLHGERIAFGAADPSWGVLNATGQIQPVHKSNQANLQDSGASFQVATNGEQVRFGLESGGKRPVVFDLAARQLRFGVASNLTSPRMIAPGLNITDWKDSETPKLNGQPLTLEQYEMSSSIAIAPDQQRFILGASWTLRCFNQIGKELWQQAVPDAVLAVNVSPDGRLGIAGYADGTIRWHRMIDGKEVLALFVTKDGKHWIAWTPNGYYDAAPGAEDFIGWHVNLGISSTANFYPVARFRDQFYRPDVVALALQTLDPDAALHQANTLRTQPAKTVAIEQRLPPTIRILTPTNGTTFSNKQLTISYQADSPADAPVTKIRPLIDGRPLDMRGVGGVIPKGSQALTITLPERNLTLALIAENRHGVSEPSQIQLKWQGVIQNSSEFVIKPKLYVLAIGESDYHESELYLEFPAKDAQDFVNVISKQKDTLYRDVEVKILKNATRQQILKGLEWLEREVTAKDVAMLFLAGHGDNDRNGNYYFIPVDANPERLKSTAVFYADIKSTLVGLPGKTLLFLDTCHAGNVMGSRRSLVPDVNQVVNDLIRAENGIVVFTASTGRQYAMEHKSWGNGAFTKALVE
ncbi:hypothetical protein TI05_13035, partial [Achromatium sp. WMS3]